MKSSSCFVSAIALFAALACSPKADPIPKGGAHYQIAYSSDPAFRDRACGLPSAGGLGDPDPPNIRSGDLPVTDFGDEFADGQAISGGGKYLLECTVTKGGRIKVFMEGPNTSPSAASTSGATHIEVNGSIDPDTGVGQGTVSVFTTESSSTTSTAPCEFYAVEDPANPGEYMIESRNARFTFVCPQAVPNRSSLSICETRGTVVVRDCLDE